MCGALKTPNFGKTPQGNSLRTATIGLGFCFQNEVYFVFAYYLD